MTSPFSNWVLPDSDSQNKKKKTENLSSEWTKNSSNWQKLAKKKRAWKVCKVRNLRLMRSGPPRFVSSGEIVIPASFVTDLVWLLTVSAKCWALKKYLTCTTDGFYTWEIFSNRSSIILCWPLKINTHYQITTGAQGGFSFKYRELTYTHALKQASIVHLVVLMSGRVHQSVLRLS